jgi:hypothetical protein
MIIDKHKNTNFTINPLPNGLSDHEAQILILHNIKIQNSRTPHRSKRLINEFIIPEFKLSYESWDEIFTEDSVDSVFNSFLNTYLRIFYHSFPLKKSYHNHNNKAWITTGIKISSQHKRDLYLLCRGTKNPKLKSYYKTYCGILSEVIKTAKKLHYNKRIINCNNEVKTMWDILKTETKKNNADVPPLNIDGNTSKDHQNIANIFNTYFSTVTDKMSANNSTNINVASNAAHPLSYLYQVFIRPFPNIKLTPLSTKEVNEIIKSLKWKNSHGYGEIPIKILKISLPFIISPLTYICNRSLSTGTFPT